MTRKANFYIEKSGIVRKIFKLFTDNNGDLYFSFSNCKTSNYRSGYAVIKAGKTDHVYTPTVEGNSSTIPLKLSYHQDGQMHFKTIDNSRIHMPKYHKLAETKTTPFLELGDSHFMTIDIEGIERFDVATKVNKNEYNRVFKVDDDLFRFKFILAGSSNPVETTRKHFPVEILSIGRNSAPNPLHIAVQFQSSNIPLGKNYDKDSLVFSVICGFRQDDNTPEKDMKFLYLFAE